MSKTAKRKRHVIACARVSKGDDASSVAAPAPKPPAPAPTPSRPGVLRPPRPTPSREFSGGSFARALRQATLLPAAARAKHYNHNDYGADADDVSEPSHIAQGTPAPPAPKTVAMRGPKTMKSVTIVNINDLHKGVKRDGLAKAKRLKKGDYGKGSGTGNSNRKAPKCTAGCGMRMGAGSSNKTHQTWKCGQCGTQTVLPKPAKKSLDVASDVSVTKHINTENDTMTKSNLEELFSDELAKSIDAEPAIITCPHCDCGITKSQVLEKARLGLGDIDLFELNEAFAAQMLACGKELGLDEAKVNVNGGAIALGHPIGASGARVLVTLLYAMQQRGAKRGLVSLCLGGGNAVAMIVERG